MPATLPQGGLARLAKARRYSRAKKPSSKPMSKWSQGKRAVTGIVPKYGAIWMP